MQDRGNWPALRPFFSSDFAIALHSGDVPGAGRRGKFFGNPVMPAPPPGMEGRRTNDATEGRDGKRSNGGRRSTLELAVPPGGPFRPHGWSAPGAVRFRRGESAEWAFEALVERHGPMVMGVCRRILSDPHDAEDAFQATFLVLVRRAGSVRVDDSLGRW